VGRLYQSQNITITEYDREEETEALQAENSSDFVALPSKFDIDEYSILEDFCRSSGDQRVRERLSETIQGSGAFRRFKAEIRRLDLEDAWYRFREKAFESTAATFLDTHGIPYKRP